MNRLLVVGATSDLAKSFMSSIENDDVQVDVLVRNPDKLLKSQLSIIKSVHVFDLNKLDDLVNFNPDVKYSSIIFFQGIDIIKPFVLYTIQNIVETFNINILSTISLLNILISKKCINKGASIILISSISGLTKGTPGHVIYSSSKAASNGLVKSLSLELSKRKIRINSISPGLIQTESLFNKNNDILSNEKRKDYSDKYPLGIGEADSLNGTIKFLFDNSSQWITGQNIIVDGGNSNM
tara:strand:+ start:216 stop:932 length:717 start_codon:yes stop_codon:yes gene_type:complete